MILKSDGFSLRKKGHMRKRYCCDLRCSHHSTDLLLGIWFASLTSYDGHWRAADFFRQMWASEAIIKAASKTGHGRTPSAATISMMSFPWWGDILHHLRLWNRRGWGHHKYWRQLMTLRRRGRRRATWMKNDSLLTRSIEAAGNNDATCWGRTSTSVTPSIPRGSVSVLIIGIADQVHHGLRYGVIFLIVGHDDDVSITIVTNKLTTEIPKPPWPSDRAVDVNTVEVPHNERRCFLRTLQQPLLAFEAARPKLRRIWQRLLTTTSCVLLSNRVSFTTIVSDETSKGFSTSSKVPNTINFVLNLKGEFFMYSSFYPFVSFCKNSSIILAKFCDDGIKNGWEALTSFYITNKRSLFKKRKWPYFGAFFVLWRFQGQSSQSSYLKFKLVSILHSYNEYYVISSFKSLQHSISN